MKKLAYVISLILIISSISTQVFAAEVVKTTIQFTDVSEKNPAKESIQKLVEAGYVKGYPDGTFKPEGNITRAEIVRMVNQVFAYTQKQETTNLKDIKAEDWFYDDVLIAQNAGYIKGYLDNTFKPDNNITREELCTILVAINQFVELPYDKVIADEVSPWAAGYVNKIVSNRMMMLDDKNNFRAKEKATRSEVCKVLANFVVVEDKPVVAPVAPVAPPVVPVTGGGGVVPVVAPDATQQKINDAVKNVTQRLSTTVLSNVKTDAEKAIVSAIISNMNAYQNNNQYNYTSAAEATRASYDRMSREEKDDLQYWVQISNPTSELITLKDFFFPGL